MIDRFERLRRRPRPLTSSERLQVSVALAAILIALELWFGERLGFGLGIVAGWTICEVHYWLGPRGG